VQVAASQRARSEHQQRLGAARRESDDKVGFLLQQLKAAETKIEVLETQAAPPSPSLPPAGLALDWEGAAAEHGGGLPPPPTGPGAGGARPFTPVAQAQAAARPPSGGKTPTPSSLRRLSDATLGASVASLTGRASWGATAAGAGAGGTSPDGTGTSPVPASAHTPDGEGDDVGDGDGDGAVVPVPAYRLHAVEEVQRRWEAERERREQMERRNTELTRELRAMREKLRAHDHQQQGAGRPDQ